MTKGDRIQAALDIAEQFGSIEGGHHKMWVIDQMVRALCKSEEDYADWVTTIKRGEDGPDTYEWDKGSPP